MKSFFQESSRCKMQFQCVLVLDEGLHKYGIICNRFKINELNPRLLMIKTEWVLATVSFQILVGRALDEVDGCASSRSVKK